MKQPSLVVKYQSRPWTLHMIHGVKMMTGITLAQACCEAQMSASVKHSVWCSGHVSSLMILPRAKRVPKPSSLRAWGLQPGRRGWGGPQEPWAGLDQRVLSPGGCHRQPCFPSGPAHAPSAAGCRPPAPGSFCRASPSAGPAQEGKSWSAPCGLRLHCP